MWGQDVRILTEVAEYAGQEAVRSPAPTRYSVPRDRSPEGGHRLGRLPESGPSAIQVSREGVAAGAC